MTDTGTPGRSGLANAGTATQGPDEHVHTSRPRVRMVHMHVHVYAPACACALLLAAVRSSAVPFDCAFASGLHKTPVTHTLPMAGYSCYAKVRFLETLPRHVLDTS